MGSCYSCNCFSSSQRRKILQQKQQEMEQLMRNGKIQKSNNYLHQDIHQIDKMIDDEPDDDQDQDDHNDKFSLNTIRKQRDEYDALMVTSYINHHNTTYHHDHNNILSNKIIQLIIQYFDKSSILLIETGQTELLKPNKHHIFHSIIINKDATLTTDSWNPQLKSGGTLLITCISSIHLKQNAKIDLVSKGYKGGHCTYLEDEEFLDNIHDDTDDEDNQLLSGYSNNNDININDLDDEQHINGLYASYSGESYHGGGIANNIKNNYGGGGAGQIWGSGGGGGYGTNGFRGQYDKQYNNKSCGKGGICYGTHLLNKLYLGSGGGAAYGGYSGGNGGGALRLKCKNLIMDKGSSIKCNGDGGMHKYLSGSGSGGSLHLIINNGLDIELHDHARIEAIGGEKKDLYGYGYKSDDVNNCGRGGYGRIRVQCNINGDKFRKRVKNEYKSCIEPLPYIG